MTRFIPSIHDAMAFDETLPPLEDPATAGDADQDGIPDSEDLCEDVPEDKDHFEDAQRLL